VGDDRRKLGAGGGAGENNLHLNATESCATRGSLLVGARRPHVTAVIVDKENLWRRRVLNYASRSIEFEVLTSLYAYGIACCGEADHEARFLTRERSSCDSLGPLWCSELYALSRTKISVSFWVSSRLRRTFRHLRHLSP
jgi:hypothetical protein